MEKSHGGEGGKNEMDVEGEGDREGSDVSHPRGLRFAREVIVVLVVTPEVTSLFMSSCSTWTRCSSPEQHIREAVNFICLLGGSDAPCLERLTLPSEVTMRLKVGLPVPV